MKRLKYLFALTGILMGISCSPKLNVVNSSVSIRVMSYNIHHCNPPSKPDFIDIDAVANAIAKENPDVVALQEVDVNTNRSGKINEALILAEKLKMNFFFAKAIAYDGGEYGVAILSKFPISSTNVLHLTTQAETKGEPRVLATAMLTLPGGKNIKFGCTHLDAQKAETNRMLQVKDVVNAGVQEKMPFIIAGDWNSIPGSNPVNIMDTQYIRTCQQCEFTIPVDKPKHTIDFVAFNKTNPFVVISHQVIQEKYASDHLPVFAVLKL